MLFFKIRKELKMSASSLLYAFDALEKIVPWLDSRATTALSCVNLFLNQNVPQCLSLQTVFKICDLPCINTGVANPRVSPSNLIRLVGRCQTLDPLVDGNRGLSFLIMRKGITLNEILANKEIVVEMGDPAILQELGDIAEEEDCAMLMTNNVLKNSRGKACIDQEEDVRKIGCDLPRVQDYGAVYSLATPQICGKRPYENEPWTGGRTSTRVTSWRYPLMVGGSSPSKLEITCCQYMFVGCGAGARWLVPLLPPFKTENDV
jgi:hypothetical protein